jgi:hypothetical protein
MKWILGLGDKQFPLADLTYVEVEARTSPEACDKAKAKHVWAFVMSAIAADSPHFKRFDVTISEHIE